ncbi:MAG: ROK family transcriptional regulator [Spirochaetaceae bacterium]|jgi:glucokinase-like ROK family protein|nr:ROK family transcriptional regulator [Spirochaetaceae bacterium]
MLFQKPQEPIPEKGDQSFLRSRNTAKILQILRQNGAFSRVDLAEHTNLDKKTVLNIVNDLLGRNMIRVTDRQSDGAGRPKEILGINGDYARYAGIDLGGTHLSGVVVNYSGEQLASHDVEVRNGMEPETLMKLCMYLMDNLLKKAELMEYGLSGIGISFPGFASSSTGNVTSEDLPKWQDIPLRKMFQDRYKIPIFVEDSSRLLALAELWFGAGRDCDNFIVADLGFGIGCGIVIDRKIFRGSTGKCGEIGHTLVDVNGPPCTCGSHGCIESFAAGWALSRQAQTVKQRHPDTLLRETSGNAGEGISAGQVILAANLGDPYCGDMLARAGEYIGIGLSNAISFFNPRRLIIGGRLIQDNEIMLRSIVETINKKCMKQILDDADITVSKLGGGASAWGAGISCVLGAEDAFLSAIQNRGGPG